MNRTDGVQADLYEKVLEHARREIDEASGKIEDLRLTLQLLEARVEAAKSVYEAVAARLNLEDELEGEPEAQAYPVAPPEQAPEPPEEPEVVAPPPVQHQPVQPLPAPEPPEEPVLQAPVVEQVPAVAEQTPVPEISAEAPVAQAATEGSGNGNGGFSMDLIRRHFEQKGDVATDQAPPSPSSGQAAKPAGNSAFPELSEAERKLIEEHMRSRAESERKG
jgi:outer membrane biosynthesis protein TonB